MAPVLPYLTSGARAAIAYYAKAGAKAGMAKAARTLLTSDLALIVGGGLTPLPWRLAATCQVPNVEASQPHVENRFISVKKTSFLTSNYAKPLLFKSTSIVKLFYNLLVIRKK